MLFWINFLILQWLGLRLATNESGEWMLMGFVMPMSGWIFSPHDPLRRIPHREEYYPRPPRMLVRLD
jgi:hypothetical protein